MSEQQQRRFTSSTTGLVPSDLQHSTSVNSSFREPQSLSSSIKSSSSSSSASSSCCSTFSSSSSEAGSSYASGLKPRNCEGVNISSYEYTQSASNMYTRSLELPVTLSGRSSNPRRQSRNEQTDFHCSQQSILSAMDRFVKSVNDMDSTVLIPSRLKDMEINGRLSPPQHVQAEDLYSFYSILINVKNELLWGPASGVKMPAPSQSLTPSSNQLSSLSMQSIIRAPSVQQHKRQPSNGSLGSATSDADTDSESVSDFGLMNATPTGEPHSTHLAVSFRHHLQGLHTILQQLADSADYLSARYQDEVECNSV